MDATLRNDLRAFLDEIAGLGCRCDAEAREPEDLCDRCRAADLFTRLGDPNAPEMWAVRVSISGGWTGSRSALLKNEDGAIRIFTKTGAYDAAVHLTAKRAGLGVAERGRATFTYVPEPYAGENAR